MKSIENILKRKRNLIRKESKNRVRIKSRNAPKRPPKLVSRRSHKFPPQGDLPGIGTDFICYSYDGCDSGSSNNSDHQSGQKWPNKDDFIKVEVKSDPWEELTPNNIILDHIQPDTLGQCVLRELNVLLVLKGLDLYFQYKEGIRLVYDIRFK